MEFSCINSAKSFSEIYSFPPFMHAGLIGKTFRAIFVEREEQGSRTRAVREIRRYASAKGEWPQIVIFPEGILPYSGKLTFEGENFHEFRNFTATHESFLHEILGMPHPLCDQFTFRKSFLSEMLPSY